MPEFRQIYNFNSLWIFVFFCTLNFNYYEYIFLLFNKIYLCNTLTFFIIINIIGLYLFLKNINFEINIKLNMSYNKIRTE
jgi:hypothetical protein